MKAGENHNNCYNQRRQD